MPLSCDHVADESREDPRFFHQSIYLSCDHVADDPVTAAPAIRVPARGTPTEMRDTQIQWATKTTAGQIVGAYQSRVSMGCLKIAKSKQPEQILGKPWQRNFWEHINPLTS